MPTSAIVTHLFFIVCDGLSQRPSRSTLSSFHLSPKDSLTSRLTLQSAFRQIALRMNARSPFANKRSDDSDLA
jgi:hypothetical protein